jgi:signal transduction histidine kinase/ligand-binding sensor domain-containing protein
LLMRFFVFPFLLFPFLLQAQPPSKIICKHLNNRNGLMHGTITSMVQDKNGFIWVAGDEGLQRYDGYEFVNYYHNPNKPNQTFPNGRLVNVSVDRKNRLWIGSFSNGFGWFDALSNSNKAYSPTSQKILSADAVGYRNFLFANDSVTYSCSNNGLVKLIHDSIVKVFTTANSPLQGGLIGRIAKDKKGNIWIGTVSGLNFLSADEKHLYNHTNNSSIAAFSKNVMKDNIGNKAAIAELFIDSRNNLWISTWKPEIYRYNIDGNKLETIVLPNKKVYEYDNMGFAFVEDNDGNIWIGSSNNGLYKYSYTTNSYVHYMHNPDDVQSIGTNAITQLIKDKQGNIWVAGENIISMFNPAYKLVQNILPTANSNVTATMVAKDRTLWAADIEWLYQFDDKLVLQNKYRHQANINQKRLENSVWGLKESLNGKEIFLEKQEGLAIFNKQTNKFEEFKGLPILKNNPITDIIELPDGNMYLLRWWWEKNLLFFDREKRTVIPIQLPIDDRNNFEISCAIQKNPTNYYLFSKRGLMLLDIKNNKVQMLDSNYVVGQTIMLNSQFLSATATVGIMQYDIASKKTSIIGKYDGFPVNNTKRIVHAGNNNFWVASSSGLIKWDKQHNSFITFNEDNGIIGSGIYGNSLSLMPNGKVVFSNGSLLVLDTALIQKQEPPSVSILSCTVGDSVLTPSQLQKEISVSYTNNVVQLRFAAINYSDPNIQYEYMLEGYDKTWQDGKLRFVNYTNLPHGDYVFKVRAVGNEDAMNNGITKLNLHVTQAFYKAWWFYAMLAIIVFGAVFYYYRSRINRLLELQKLRNNISRDLHDEVGSTLSSISILSTSVVQNMEREPIKTKEWVNQIGKYAQHMLNVMDDIVWAINPKMDSFENMVSRMKEVAYSTTEAADIQVHFNYDEQLNNISLPMLTKRNLYLIFKETVNNAIKHAGCKSIQIDLRKSNNKLVLHIKDDGRGFDTNKEVNRNGLKNIKQRAEEINAVVGFDSKENEGTSMELTIAL